MKKKLRVVLCLVLALLMTGMFSVGASAFSTDGITVQPRARYATVNSITLWFEGFEDGYAYASITRTSAATKMDCTLVVYRLLDNGVWEWVFEDYAMLFAETITLQVHFETEPNRTYKAELVADIYNGNTFLETVTAQKTLTRS